MCRARDRHFLAGRHAGEREQVQFANLHIVSARFVVRQCCCAAAARGQLPLNFAGVEQVQALGQVGFARPFAFAGAARFRPAEDGQEVRVEAVVGQLHRRVPAARRPKLRLRAGHLIDGVEQHFGIQPLGIVAREVLLVVLVPIVRLGSSIDRRRRLQIVRHQVLQIELVSMKSSARASSNPGLMAGLVTRMSSSGSTRPRPKKCFQ